MFKSLRSLLNIKVIIVAVIFAIGLFSILMVLLWTARSTTYTQAPATALLKLIAAPTITPPSPTITITPTINPSSSQEAPTGGENIKIGDYVQVSGTGGDGLRLHTTPGISSEADYIAIESEVLFVENGPSDADGYTWWLLQDPYTKDSVGWGVSVYLTVVQNP